MVDRVVDLITGQDVELSPGSDGGRQLSTPWYAKAVSGVCHYIDSHHGGVKVTPTHSVHMMSKNAAQKRRDVCSECLNWMVKDSLVDDIVDLEFGSNFVEV